MTARRILESRFYPASKQPHVFGSDILKSLPLLLKGSFHCLEARSEEVLPKKKKGDRFIDLETGVPRSACPREMEVIVILYSSTVLPHLK
jgi:hypothetical protein